MPDRLTAVLGSSPCYVMNLYVAGIAQNATLCSDGFAPVLLHFVWLAHAALMLALSVLHKSWAMIAIW